MDLEILAPVGDEKGIEVAINSGANAVYFGLPKFNARAKAENITISNLREIVSHCHLFNVKVYVTINTIIKDDEVKEFLDLVKCAVDAKVDAFIIQDLGMAHLLKNSFKGIVLHASTQMGVHNLLGAKMLEEMGISRVVLSRETKLEDIKLIKQNTNLEIEYFVQGALCVAFSGNCYLSSLNNNKSGNRGECAQLCRLKYSAFCDGKEVNAGYLLSTADLCLIKNLQLLIDAGVTSFKIEGRLRRYGYIAESVKTYSNVLHNLQNANVEKCEYALSKVFNRGKYNKGIYLTENNNASVINSKFQNHRGIKIGKVVDVKPFKNLNQITIFSNHKLSTNDGLKFIKDEDEISVGVGNVIELKNNEYKIFSIKKPKVNSEVYLTVDSVHEKELLENKKLIDVDVFVELDKYSLPYIRLRSGKVVLEVYGDEILEPAKTSPISIQNVKECFSKVDNFPFRVNCACALGGVFIAKSVLNDLRRKSFEQLFNKLVLDYETKNVKNVKFQEFESQKIVDNSNVSAIITNNYNEALNDFDIVVFKPNKYDLSVIDEFYLKYNKKFYLYLPVIANYNDIKIIDSILKKYDSKKIGLVANNLWGLYYAKQGYEIVGGYGLNIANKSTVAFLNSLGVTTFIKSVEPILNKNCEFGLEYVGNVALMTFCHCPYKTAYNYSLCSECKFDGKLKYVDNLDNEYNINRYQVSGCYFELKENKVIKIEKELGKVVDIT